MFSWKPVLLFLIHIIHKFLLNTHGNTHKFTLLMFLIKNKSQNHQTV